MVGPEFIAMTAGESENPRKLMHRAFTSFVWRLLLFFLGGALCVGIVIPYNDELLLKYIEGTEGGTGAAYVLCPKISPEFAAYP
jgi:amino acid transporter